jgi:ankyrin repeat protein
MQTTPLRIALERGFHSLVELLARNDVGQEAKNQALLDAVTHRNLEFVELLLKLGADISSAPFSDVLLSWDPKLIRFFLRRGAISAVPKLYQNPM